MLSRLYLVLLAAAATIASPVALPQGVTQVIPAKGDAPAGCQKSSDSTFGITAVRITSGVKRRGINEIEGNPVGQISDGQVQNHPSATVPPVTVISDGQPQAPTHQPSPPPTPATGPSGSSTTAVASTHGSSPSPTRVACKTDSTLALTLKDGILKDRQGRTGYIASNYQFQFDNPPQAGSIITAGFSVCGNGSLALGGSEVFWECQSGSFYNLYDRYWASQCHPVLIETLELKDC